jgi:hypothetical protein
MVYDYLTDYADYSSDLAQIRADQVMAANKRLVIVAAIEDAADEHLTIEPGDYRLTLSSTGFTLSALDDYEFTPTQLLAFEAEFSNATLTVSAGAIIVEISAPP